MGVKGQRVRLTDAGSEAGVGHEARVAQTSEAADGVQTPAVQTHTVDLAFIHICRATQHTNNNNTLNLEQLQ